MNKVKHAIQKAKNRWHISSTMSGLPFNIDNEVIKKLLGISGTPSCAFYVGILESEEADKDGNIERHLHFSQLDDPQCM